MEMEQLSRPRSQDRNSATARKPKGNSSASDAESRLLHWTSSFLIAFILGIAILILSAHWLLYWNPLSLLRQQFCPLIAHGTHQF